MEFETKCVVDKESFWFFRIDPFFYRIKGLRSGDFEGCPPFNFEFP